MPESGAAGERPCPVCQPANENADLAAQIRDQLEAAQQNYRQWEERTGWKLELVVTRHAAILTQLTPAQAKEIGTAIETLTLHLKRLTESLVLTPTRPNTYELIVLWEKESWDHFREVMERLYTRDQLGEFWGSARGYNSYDHFVTPHFYETSESIRSRPVTCGAVYLAGRRQIDLATGRQAPFWLTEGFAAYGDYVVHKVNRWFAVYDKSRAPTAGDWMVSAKRMASGKKFRPWSKILTRHMRDFEPPDYHQSLAMVAFLLESEPPKFLDFARRLRGGAAIEAALEEAYGKKLEELESRLGRWLLARR